MNTGVNCQVFPGIMKYGHTTEAARQLCKGHHSFSLKHSKVDLHIWKNVSGNKSFDILISDAENTVSSPSQGAPTYSQTAVQRPSAPFIETISSLTSQWICNSDGTIFPKKYQLDTGRETSFLPSHAQTARPQCSWTVVQTAKATFSSLSNNVQMVTCLQCPAAAVYLNLWEINISWKNYFNTIVDKCS